MTLKKFKQMCTDYDDFMKHIKHLSKQYATINNIKDPLKDYDMFETYCEPSEVLFNINEDQIKIYFEESGDTNCGYYDVEQMSITIPESFFDESTHNQSLIEAEEKQEKIFKLESKLSDLSKDIALEETSIKILQNDNQRLRQLQLVYPEITDSIDFVATINQHQIKIEKLKKQKELLKGNK